MFSTELVETNITPLPDGRNEVKVTVKYGEREYWAKETARQEDDPKFIAQQLKQLLDQEIKYAYFVMRPNARQTGRPQ